ncbi:hypothetical protein FNV43_RR18865 [Rhamnella rubrinervis]|uniref:Uncharacterized protein n=1 Tax=Rhamnella rubrinervis TaxID=2594499 RepID=A0A8K0E5E8_9ROSA|nr:hypothetical protein FNV43_RR18865 [Rhamnella rubrinervis]
MRNLSYSLWTKYFGESGPMTQTVHQFKNIEFKYDNDQEIWDNVESHVLFRGFSPDRSRLVKKNNFTIIENDNLLEKYPWGTYAMILRFPVSVEDGRKHKTSYDLSDFLLHFDVGLSCDTHGSHHDIAFLCRISKDARIPFPNILHYNRWPTTSSTKTTPEPEPEQEPVYTTRASTQSQPEGAHSQYLEGMINELREDFANIEVTLDFNCNKAYTRVEDNGGRLF